MHNFILGPVDTDSISFCKPDMSPFSEEEQEALLREINSMMPNLIQYAHDGYYDTVVCIRAKNYILYDGEEIVIKGSGLKASMKESALKEFIQEVINYLVFDKKDEIIDLYYKYIKEINSLTDISRYVLKKTVTESVLNPKRTNEQKVLDALNGQQVQMGDKIYLYFTKDGSLKLQDDWNGDHDVDVLMKKLFNTLEVFSTVLDMTQFPKFHNKSHPIKCQLADVLGLPHPEKTKRGKKVANT